MSKLYGFFNSDMTKTTLTKRGHNKISCKLQSWSGDINVDLYGDNEANITIRNLNVKLNGSSMFRTTPPTTIDDVEQILKNNFKTLAGSLHGFPRKKFKEFMEDYNTRIDLKKIKG